MARGEALRFGPFIGGLNTGSDPTAVADSELVDCNNFELDIDGSLIGRPPIMEAANLSTSWTKRIVIIGNATFATGASYIIGSNSDGTYAFDGTTWTVILAGLESRVSLQYNDNVYIIPAPTSGVSGGRWNPTSGFTADASMPKGEAAVIHKTRMYVVPGISSSTNSSRLTFTDPITSTTLTWTGTNILDVGPGDGEKLVDVIVYNDNLLLFKQDSTYLLAYDLQPSDAILRAINTTIGATTRRCVVQYENSVYVYHEGNVFEVVNYDFSRINIKVPFLFDATAPSTRLEEVFLSLVGDRLICRYYNRVYVYGLKTRTWSRWSSSDIVLHNFGPLTEFPSNPTQSVSTKYYAGSAVSGQVTLVFIPDGYDAVTKEQSLANGAQDIACSFLTKNYDLADSHHFKKMTWWGCDVFTTRDVIGLATPIVTSFQVTWNDLSTRAWNSLGTWNQPLINSIVVETDVTVATTASRKFIKFLKTMRFRQINYQVKMLYDGTTSQGPCRLFTLTAIIASKQTVPKQVN
jgi:hypothetical protein